MVNLIHFEYRKNFKKISILVAILLFSILDIVKINGVYTENSFFSRGYDVESLSRVQPRQLYWHLYDNYSGKITDKKIQKLLSIFRPMEKKVADRTASTATNVPNTYTGNYYNDYNFFNECFINPMEYFYTYGSYAQGVASTASKNISFYRSIGNAYEARKNAAIESVFKGRSIKDFTYTEMYQFYTHYDFSSILILLICLYGLVGVFVCEKETEMDVVLLTTRSGGKKTIAAKIFSSAIFVLLVSLWFSILDFLSFAFIFGSLKGACSPMYAIQDFSNAALNVSLWQYAILSAVMKALGMLVLGAGALLLSCLFQNALLPFVIGLSAVFGLAYLQNALMGSGRVLMKTLNPFILLVNRELFGKTEFINFLGYPVPSYLSAMIFAILLGALFLIGISILVRKNTVTGRRAQ